MHNLKLYFILLLLLPLQILGQGLPYIKSYKASKYGGGVQNWDTYIDKSNIVYFSNNEGITTFDGKNWENISDSRLSYIRCMSMGADNKLYVGGLFELGYFEPNQLGKLEYTSLMDRIVDKELEFTYVWNIAANSSAIAFTIRGEVLLYDMDSIRVIKSDCKLVRVYSVFDNILLFSYGEGIFKLEGTKFIPLPELDFFKDDTYVIITEFADNQILICSELSGIWIYDFGARLNNKKQPSLKKIETSIDKNFGSELLSDVEYDSFMNTIHICTMSTLYSLDTLGNTKNILDYKQGIVDKHIISLKCDRFGNVWVGAGNGVSHVHTSSPIRYIDDRLGDPEHPYDVIFNHDYSYFTNLSGLYIIKTEDLFCVPPKPLKQLIASGYGGWGMHSIDNKVFASVDNSLNEIVAGKIKSKIVTSDSYSLTYYSQKDQILIVGGIDNSYLFDIKNKNSLTKIENLTGTIRKVIGIGEYHVIAKFFSDKTFNIYRDSTNNDVFQLIDKKLGFDARYSMPVLIDSNAYICASNGLYKIVFNKDKSVDTVFLDKNFEQFEELKNNLLNIVRDTALDGYWAITTEELMFIKNHNNKPSELIKNPFRIVLPSEKLTLINNYIVTFLYDGICFYDKSKPRLDTIKFNTLFREIEFGDETLFKGYYPFDNESYNIKIEQPIKYENNSLKVYFASPCYFYQDSIKHECILENFDKEWICIGSDGEKEYTNIPPGNYCFKVRGINVFNNVSDIAELHFSISKPWYQTAWMIAIYVIVAIIFVMLTIKIYTHRLKKQNELLEKAISNRTAELRLKAQDISKQNEQIKEQNKQIKTQNEQIKEQNERIKEQSKNLEVVNKQLTQLSVVAQQTDNGVLIIKIPETIRYINEGMLKMLDIENFTQISDRQSKSILLRLHNLTSILQETFNTSEHIVFEEKITTFKNRKKWLQFTVSPIYQSGIQTDKAVVLCTDITAIKLAEEEISQKKDELYSQSELLKDANLELEKANQLMRNSMTYAQRIQKSMLPNLADIRTVFEDTFIFFMPKDIVSGDFYWFNKIDDSYILIVADCTGHGVPGAFMSMIGNTLLKDTVSKKMDNPAEILSYLNDGIRTTLRQKDNIDDMQSDGMDITVCIYNPKLREIQIALANHRALLIKKDEIIIVDGDIFAVGGSFTNRISIEFTNKKYSIEKGDILYMYTDGFQDQLGGTDYSKYGGSEFLKYLASIFGESFNIQFSKLKNEFLTWKNDKNQTDDVLIWGIKF